MWQPAATRAAPGISAHPSEENLRYFNVMILGPQQSPYEGAPPAASAAVPARDRHAVCWRAGPRQQACHTQRQASRGLACMHVGQKDLPH